RATHLVDELGELVKVRKQIAGERDQLAVDRDKMSTDQQRLSALVDARQKQQNDLEQDIKSERQRAEGLAKQAGDLKDLIAKMELDLRTAAKAAATANLQGAPVAANGKPDFGALKDPG